MESQTTATRPPVTNPADAVAGGFVIAMLLLCGAVGVAAVLGDTVLMAAFMAVFVLATVGATGAGLVSRSIARRRALQHYQKFPRERRYYGP